MNKIAEPGEMSLLSLFSKNTCSKSSVSPWVNRHYSLSPSMPATAAQGTTPGEVEVDTNDSRNLVYVSKPFHLGNFISILPSFGTMFDTVIPTVSVEYSPTI